MPSGVFLFRGALHRFPDARMEYRLQERADIFLTECAFGVECGRGSAQRNSTL
jgi:hypothetical protein